MTTSNQLSPGMTISLDNKLYRVESCVKVTVQKGLPFIKAKLRNLDTNDLVEKNFKLNQAVKDVILAEKKLEFLYPEDEGFLCLDVVNLDLIMIPEHIVGDKVSYLKEGVELKAFLFADTVYTIELPQFLELMVAKTQASDSASGGKMAILETGAKVEIPPFIETGDIIKVDTKSDEYIQRV